MQTRIAIIGGGLVGLASAYQLDNKVGSVDLTVFEKEPQVARHQSGRNSGVIHSGIYYRPGSAKAETCRRGKDLLTAYCRERRIEFATPGKLIVATRESQLDGLQELLARGLKNGVSVEHISGAEAREIEPHTAARAALWVPETGIVNYAQVARALANELSGRGHSVQLETRVTSIKPGPTTALGLAGKGARHFDLVINCAGVHADQLARKTYPELDLRIVPFLGQYYRLREPRRFSDGALIYPVPHPSFPFLGVHLTPTLTGEVLCGPNAVLALGREAYSRWGIDAIEVWSLVWHSGFRRLALRHWRTGLEEIWRSMSRRRFAASAAELVPGIRSRDLTPGPSGIRAQAIDRRGRMLDDFVIRSQEGVLHVLNAPSPAATACLAIGERIADQALELLREAG